MTSLLRKYQQPALIAVTVLILVTFIWFWNGNQGGRGALSGANKVASIYNQSVSDADVKADVRKFQIAEALGLQELVQAMAGTAQNQQEALENFVWNSYVFQHEADVLQVFPTDAEVQTEMATVPGFQTDGQFDPAKLTDFVQNKLPALGFSDSIIDELVRDQVRVRKVQELIGSTVAVTPSEMKSRYIEENEKMDLSVVRLDTSDVEKSIAVSDQDAKKAYDQHPENYRSDEQRKVAVASFELTEAQKALKGKDRTDALQKVGNDAWNFAQTVVDKSADFAAEAKKGGVKVSASAFFPQNAPDANLGDIPTLGTTTFKLSKDLPSSDVLEGQNGYYVVHLEDIQPSAQLTFDQSKAKIIADIQKDRAAQLMQTKATDARNQIVAGLKAGKSFADAAKAAGFSAETIPPFALRDVSKMDVPDAQTIVQSAISLGDHQLGEFVQTESGGLMVYLNGRQAPDQLTASLAEAAMKSQYVKQKEIGAFIEWLRLRKEAARLQIVQRAS